MLLPLALLTVSPASADEFKPLYAPHATSSSYLKSDWNKYTENYHPSFILDGNPRTAWVEGADGNGIGETIEWRTSFVDAVDKVRIRLRNGYQKSEKLLTANAAPREIRVVWLTHYNVPITSKMWTLDRKMGWQEIVLDPPDAESFGGVRLEIVSAHPGRVYEDLCISDAEVAIVPAEEGNDATPYSGPIEQAKRQVLLDWVEERQATAAYFAAAPEKYPFAATSFTSRDVELTDAEKARALGRIGVFDARVTSFGIAKDTAEPGWYRLGAKATVRAPDGLEELHSDVMRWFTTDREMEKTDDEWRSKTKAINLWHLEHNVGNARIARRDDGTVAAATTRIYDLYEERGTYSYDRRYLMDFDASGQVSSIYVQWTTEGDGCDVHRNREVWDVAKDGAGRINRLTRTTQHICEGSWDTEDKSTTTGDAIRTVFSPIEG